MKIPACTLYQAQEVVEAARGLDDEQTTTFAQLLPRTLSQDSFLDPAVFDHHVDECLNLTRWMTSDSFKTVQESW
jgi:hypothetical protein